MLDACEHHPGGPLKKPLVPELYSSPIKPAPSVLLKSPQGIPRYSHSGGPLAWAEGEDMEELQGGEVGKEGGERDKKRRDAPNRSGVPGAPTCLSERSRFTAISYLRSRVK